MMKIDTRRASSELVGRPTSTVLVVEDDTAIRGLVAELLIGEGYAVVEAADSEQGLRCAQQLNPDLILLDLGLPLTNGLDVLEALRAHQATRHIPVVVVSGHRSLSRQAIGGSAGLIEKPFDLTDLLDHVQRLTTRG